MIDIQIATYWNVETLYYVFNGVAAIMGGAGFMGLLKMVFYFALTLGIFAYAGNRQLELAKWFIQALIFTTLLNMPIARVAITDNTGLEPPRVVDNVPFTLAIVAQTTNLAFGWATRTYETVFGVPDELGLQKGDLAFGHRILKNVNKAVIRDPGVRADLMQFIKECTLYDIKDGVITPDQVVGQTDTWNTIFSNTSPARYTTYNTLTAAPTTDTCTNAAVVLKGRVDSGIDAAQTFYGKQAFTRANSDAIASSMFGSAIGSSYDWILASSASASDAMKQAMFNNIWRDAGSELPALMGDTARIQELQNMAGAAQAAKQADGSNGTLAMLAQETLPHMRNWLEAIIYALFPIVVVLMVVVSAEGAKKIIGGYMMSLAWVNMWPVMFAVINHLSLMHLRHKMAALNLAAGVPFQLSDAFDATLGDEQAAIGYLVVLVPFISGAIVRMGQGGFMSLADRMVTGFSGAGAAVGSSLASGNVSMGQAGVDTASVNTTSMHKHDSNIGLNGGGATIGYGNGNTGTMAANGSIALQQFQNRMLTSMAEEKRLQSERAEEGHETSITSAGRQVAYRHSDASTLTDVKGHDNTRGSFQNTGVSTQTAKSGAETGIHSGGQGINKTLADRSSFNASTGVQDTAHMGLGLGRGNTSGGSEGANLSNADSAGRGQSNVPKAAEEKRIAEGMRRGGATQAEIDGAIKNYRGGETGTAYRTVTDDYGNQVRIPVGQQKPSAAAPARMHGRGLPVIDANLGLQSQKTYSAAHSRDRSDGTQYSRDESARIERTYSNSGQRATTAGAGDQSAQNNRSGRDAALSNVDERSTVRDVSDRSELGVGNRASRSENDSFSSRHDLMADPNLMEKVAARNGMSAARFMGQEEGRVMQMVRAYAAEKGVMTGATTMPKRTLGGDRLPTSKRDLTAKSLKDEKDLPNDIAERHKKKVAQTGFQGAGPINVDTSTPAIATDAEREVKAQLDPNAKGSIPHRAAALDENVSAWASHDKKLGEGRANPMAVVEDMEGRDLKDTGEKIWDKLTGGDGMADGEKLNENKKRETGSDVQINNPITSIRVDTTGPAITGEAEREVKSEFSPTYDMPSSTGSKSDGRDGLRVTNDAHVESVDRTNAGIHRAGNTPPGLSDSATLKEEMDYIQRVAGFRGDWQMQDTFKIKGGGAVHESITKEAARLAGVPFTKELEKGVRWPDVPSTKPGETSYTGLAKLLMPERFKNTLTVESHDGANQYWHSMARTDDQISNAHVLGKIVDQAREWYTEAQRSKSAFEVGKILHMVQDSYSASHVVRNERGEIEAFQDYGKQDHTAHGHADRVSEVGMRSWKDIPGASDAVKASSEVLRLYKRDAPFSELEALLRNNVYKFAPGYENATAGGADWKYRKKR
jgi:conjugal transfer mating pair stabilization protein TraG